MNDYYWDEKKPFLPKSVANYLHRIRRLGKFSIIRKIDRFKLDSNCGLDVLVVSPGGVATTFLINYIGIYKNVNNIDDNDGLKHLPRPPINLENINLKVIFITGEPDEVYASIKRRGWLKEQGAKLGSVMSVLLWGRPQKYFFKRAVIAQEKHWRKSNLKGLLILDYNQIWDSIETISQFMGVNTDDFVNNFPSKKPRKSRPLT